MLPRLLFCAVLLASTAQARTAPAPIPQLRHTWVASPDGTHTDTPADLRKRYMSVFAVISARIDLTSCKTGQSHDLVFDAGRYAEIITERGGSVVRGGHHLSGDCLTLSQRDRDGQWRILQHVWTASHP